MLAKKIFGLSRNLRNFLSLSQSNVIRQCQRYEHFEANQLATKQSINYNDVSNDNNLGFIIPNIQKLQSSSEINEKIVGSDIVSVLKDLYTLCRTNNQHPEKIRNEAYFKDLCAVIDSNISQLEIKDLIDILKFLNKLQTPSNSKTILSLLQRIESCLDTIPIKYFHVISRIASEMDKTTEVQKFSLKLNSKFVIKLNSDIDKKDASLLAHAFYYACMHMPSKNIVFPIVDALKDCNFDTLQTSETIIILKSFSTLGKIPYMYNKIIHKTQTRLTNQLKDLRKRDLFFLFQIFQERVVTDRQQQFYNSNLYDKIAEKVLQEEFTFDDSALCLSYFNKMGHTNKTLLSYCSAVFYAEHEVGKSNKLYNFNNLLVLLTGLSHMKYKPFFWDTIYEYIQNGEIFRCNIETQLIYCFNLAALDCYDTSILENVFKMDFNELPIKTFWTYLRLWQKLQALPNYDGPQPSSEVLEKFKKLAYQPSKRFPLTNSLTDALNDTKYFKSSIKSRLFHNIDYVLILKNDADLTPQIIDQDIEFIEDLNAPSDCHIVTLFTLPSSQFCRNTGEILGAYSACYDYLRSRSYKVVGIPRVPISMSKHFNVMRYIKAQLNLENTQEIVSKGVLDR